MAYLSIKYKCNYIHLLAEIFLVMVWFIQ